MYPMHFREDSAKNPRRIRDAISESHATYQRGRLSLFYILSLADSPAPVPLYLFWALLKRYDTRRVRADE